MAALVQAKLALISEGSLVLRPVDHLTLSGEIGASDAERLSAVLDELDHDVVVDCRDLRFIDWAASKALLRTWRRLDAKGQQIRLRNAQPDVDWALQIAGLGHMLETRLPKVA